MATFLTAKNIDALKPLFKPWEEPAAYRTPGDKADSSAQIMPGRRPSRCPLVRAIRAEVDLWRIGGYAGVSETSRYLLNYWFNAEHTVIDPSSGDSIPFRYHWAQREAIESIIYLCELRQINNVASLLTEFGGDRYIDLALGIMPEEDRWLKCCCKIATGGGKTKIMSLAIVWSYFNSLREADSNLVRHFVIIAPNLTVYERLKDDFEDNKIFTEDPIIPDEWKNDFQLNTALQDFPGGDVSRGAIYLTNIHRLYDDREEEKNSTTDFRGPDVKRAKAFDASATLRNRIASHKGLMIFNDEAHHLHDPDLAWNKAIDSLNLLNINKGFAGIRMQLDFTATPKHNNGELFRHIICDFPLGEAVDAGIVKVPLLGESARLNIQGDKNIPAYEKYRFHLQVGYKRYEESYKQWFKVRKPILFVMTENSTSADEVAKYLDSDSFPLIKGRVLNIHTNLKGKVKTVRRFGKEVKEFVEKESDLKPEELKILREMTRELDQEDSKYRCIVSVMMLREGWDIKNVTIIIPLRPYSAASGILPEQTLGRGLRRMLPSSDLPETVTVIHHPAFRKLYEDELQQEGFDPLIITEQEPLKQTVTIFVDKENKDICRLDIAVPSVTDSIKTLTELSNITIEEIKREFSKYKPLPIGEPRTESLEYKESQLFTKETIATWKIDLGLLNNSWSAASFFARIIARQCRLTNPNTTILPLVEEFISKILFEREVDLYSGEVDHRMQDNDVKEHILALFIPLILSKKIVKTERKRICTERKLSEHKPYQATSTEARPAVPATKTIFNLVPCDNGFEREFAYECNRFEDVISFAKNAGPQKLTIDYLKPDKHKGLYVPDFFIRTKLGDIYVCELKGRQDNLVPLKAAAAIEWCKTASISKCKLHYLYVPYHLFQQSTADSFEELARACRPSLVNLLEEITSTQVTIDYDTIETASVADPLFAKLYKLSDISSVPEDIIEPVRQSLLLLDHSANTSMNNYAPTFQPLLLPLDKYAIRLIISSLAGKIPSDTAKRDAYFSPDLSFVPGGNRYNLLKYGRFLKDNLIFARPVMRLGTLLFCLEYAQQGNKNTGGIWYDIVTAFSGKEMSNLYGILDRVNTFRNTRIAHVELKLDNINEAWQNIALWVKCLKMMRDASLNLSE